MGAGLKHFAQVVRDKVELLRATTYKAVADELVKDELRDAIAKGGDGSQVNDANLRRRVYDVLNVLTAIGVIEKRKKAIAWRGTVLDESASGSGADAMVCCSDAAALERQRKALGEAVAHKRARVAEMEVANALYDQLVTRNRNLLGTAAAAAGTAVVGGTAATSTAAVGLPFVVISTGPDTMVQCERATDERSMVLRFDAPFAVMEDTEVLEALGLDQLAVPSPSAWPAPTSPIPGGGVVGVGVGVGGGSHSPTSFATPTTPHSAMSLHSIARASLAPSDIPR
jgi:hypothetical protein